MNTVESIKAAITSLSPEDVDRIWAWLEQRKEDEWDARIARDERDGRLDDLANRALAEHQAGRTRPL